MKKQLSSTTPNGDAGGHGSNKVGEGWTKLLNQEGYMCCLGQASLQLEPSLTKEQIINIGSPGVVGEKIPYLTTEDVNGGYGSTILSSNAITINDRPYTSPETKIEELTALFNANGLGLEVINKPN